MKRRLSAAKHLAPVALVALTYACSQSSDSDETTPLTQTGGTGGTGGTGTSDPVLTAGTLSLSAIPDLAALVDNNDTALALAVVGDAPLMSEITPSNYDEIMFGGAIADITAATTVTEDQSAALHRGESVCRNIAEAANVFRDLGGGTLCYLSKVPTLSATSITVDKEGDGITQSDYSSVFLAGDTARVVKINVNQEGSQGGGGGGSFGALITIYGKDTHPDGYAVDFVQCQDGTAQSVEKFRIDAQAGTFTSESMGGFSEGQHSSKYNRSVSAALKVSGDSLIWDLAKDRIISNAFQHSGEWGSDTGKQAITIDSDNYLTQMVHSTRSWTFGNESGSGSSKVWAKTAFSGEDAKSISLSEMALRMSNSDTMNSQTFEDTVTGAVEWSTSTYAPTTTSDLYTQAAAFDFDSADIFASAPTEPEQDLTVYDCTATPDVEVTFDMNTDEAQVVAGQCGDDGKGDALRELGQLCHGTEVQQARNKIWESQAPQ